jgi:UDP:flavonoid glycosyltransferase YjiC (YdhE family)
VVVVFYVTGHGFGHASRVIEVINALLADDPQTAVHVRTQSPRWLFDLTVKGPFTYEQVETDTGILQIDSLRLDERASVEAAAAFMTTFGDRVDREARALRRIGADIVVSDIPPLGIAAARHAGIPSVALGNFTWDWIYAAYPGTDDLVRRIAAAYAEADLALRLPMWGGFTAFKHVVDVPFIARHGTRDPMDTRRALSVPPGKRVVLPSFGGHGIQGLEQPRGLDGYHVLTGFDERRLYAEGFRYEDLVRAADVVITKPGFGIIAECLANDTALLYTDRGRFIEYDVLVAAMPRFLRAAYIGHEDLFAGRWAKYLDALLAQPSPPERPATNGAAVIKDVLLEVVQQAADNANVSS